jgi:ankyrin repeat protein
MGETALMKAIHGQFEDIASFLLSCGANPNIAPSSEDTPITWAIREENYSIINKLVQYGAKVP